MFNQTTLSLESSPVFGKRKDVISDWLTDYIYVTVLNKLFSDWIRPYRWVYKKKNQNFLPA